MWRKVGQILKVVTIWAAITGYIVYSAILAQRHKQEQSVEHVAIDVVDSTSSGQLITSQSIFFALGLFKELRKLFNKYIS